MVKLMSYICPSRLMHGIDMLQKPNNVPVSYPVMHHFNRNVNVCAHFCYNGALWDICPMHFEIDEIDQFWNDCPTFHSNNGTPCYAVYLSSHDAVMTRECFPHYRPFSGEFTNHCWLDVLRILSLFKLLSACRHRWPALAGKTFPAFLAHAQPAIYVSGKRPIQIHQIKLWNFTHIYHKTISLSDEKVGNTQNLCNPGISQQKCGP